MAPKFIPAVDVPDGYHVVETDAPVDCEPLVRSYFKWWAKRQMRSYLATMGDSPLFHLRLVKEGRMWEVRAFQNLLERGA